MDETLRSQQKPYLWLLHKAWWWVQAMTLRTVEPLVRVWLGRPLRRYSEITPQLWVGGQHYRRGWGSMQQQGITAVVNLRRGRDDAAKKRAPERYLWLPTTDNTAPGLEHIRTAVRFIEAEVQRGGVVYIHCRAGVGRAPTVAACYLVSTGMTPAAAWETIRAGRPFIRPNARQIAQVARYADELRRSE